jgi:hypothetical protein
VPARAGAAMTFRSKAARRVRAVRPAAALLQHLHDTLRPIFEITAVIGGFATISVLLCRAARRESINTPYLFIIVIKNTLMYKIIH